MTLNINLPDDVEAALTQAAEARGIDTDSAIIEAVRRWAQEETEDDAQDLLDAEEVRYRLANPDPRPYRTQAELRAHLEKASR